MKLAIITILSLFLQSYNCLAQKMNMYCNARFGYCIDYPATLIPREESTNGDGRVFNNKKNEKILTVYGRLNQDVDGNPVSLKKQYTLDLEVLQSSHSIISYQKPGTKSYVLSGIKYGNVFYRKVIGKGDSYCYAMLEYDKSEKPVYDKVSVLIAKSFK